jgi:hypothetical protein
MHLDILSLVKLPPDPWNILAQGRGPEAETLESSLS